LRQIDIFEFLWWKYNSKLRSRRSHYQKEKLKSWGQLLEKSCFQKDLDNLPSIEIWMRIFSWKGRNKILLHIREVKIKILWKSRRNAWALKNLRIQGKTKSSWMSDLGSSFFKSLKRKWCQLRKERSHPIKFCSEILFDAKAFNSILINILNIGWEWNCMKIWRVVWFQFFGRIYSQTEGFGGE